MLKRTPDRIKGTFSEIHLNVTAEKHNLIAYVNIQTLDRVHQEIDLALGLEKKYLFEKDPPNLRLKTEF